YNRDEYLELCRQGLSASPITEILVEESMVGWKEYELERMSESSGNVVVICSIENVDAMGVHTGDSITVAPAMTLSDREYQRMRDAAIAIMRRVGVQTGGANIQFSVCPQTGRQLVIEMNPRVSRSSALASKATGFPIAKLAAKLAIGYHLDELRNDITRETPASFEPSIDYVVVKLPRFTFEKFPEADPTLTTSMKSVGEAMAIGRTFKEALQKALRSLETGDAGLGLHRHDPALPARPGFEARPMPGAEEIRSKLAIPNCDRMRYIRWAFKTGMSIEEAHQLTKIDPWFLREIEELVREGEGLMERAGSLEGLSREQLLELKRLGYSDDQIARFYGRLGWEVRRRRREMVIAPVYKTVDTCAAEFAAYTPYYYGTYEEESEQAPSTERKKVMILGSGPNRIGQGIEFDYCCCHAAIALREEGYETIMVNSNPETVSTDYDTSDRLYFEPLTIEDVLHIYETELPIGVIVQLGGQTPLNLARGLERAGVPILGTSTDSIDRAEDRERFSRVAEKLDLLVPAYGFAAEPDGARAVAAQIGYPVLVRPSYVLGGRGMEIVYDDRSLERYMTEAAKVTPDHPILIDKFLEEAIEVDVDALCDRTGAVVIGGVLEHIEEAGTHSGDSSCTLPPYTLSDTQIDKIRAYTVALARELNVVGLMNVQFAIRGDLIYCIEVNPRASRTAPFISKATGLAMAKVASRLMVGRTLEELGIEETPPVDHMSVKISVFPWKRFPGVDAVSGTEMKSTGEVMGIADSFGVAFAKAQAAGGRPLPTTGKVFISVKDQEKRGVIFIAKRLELMGFDIVATRGTHRVLTRNGVKATVINKIAEGRPNILDAIKNAEIDLIVNTPTGKDPRADEAKIRSLAAVQEIPCLTTLPAASAACHGIEAMQREPEGWTSVRALQEYHSAPVLAGESA
ncbi:MAG: carbamoyl-phosphate synthase large subunit, partial [Planctomycetota bacterium]